MAPASSPENKELYRNLLNGAKRYLEESYPFFLSILIIIQYNVILLFLNFVLKDIAHIH